MAKRAVNAAWHGVCHEWGAMKPKMTLQEIAGRSDEMYRGGDNSRKVVDFVLGEVAALQSDQPLSLSAANTFGAGFFHPFNFSNVDINAIRRLCTAIHCIGRRRFASYRFVLKSQDVFSRKLRTAVWVDYMGLNLSCRDRREDWLTPYCELCKVLKAPGYEIIRNRSAKMVCASDKKNKPDVRLADALRADSVADFELLRKIRGKKLSKGWLRDHLEHRDEVAILENLIKTDADVMKTFPAVEMLLFLCSSCLSAAKAARLARALLAKCPEVASAVDCDGLTPLDYTLFRNRNFSMDGLPFREEDDTTGLERVLVEAGVSPQHENAHGISWSDVHTLMQNKSQIDKEWHYARRGLA